MSGSEYIGSSSQLVPGLLIAGRYRLDQCIGRGGMGSVWSALHTGLNQSVAVKFINQVFAGSAEARGRFDREAKAAARLRSRYVVQVFDNGELEDGTPYIVMELLEGESLASRIEQRGPVPLGEAARVLGHVGRALSHAHERGIVHRDIKPENIFLARSVDDDDFIAKVVDFGVAKVTTENVTHTAIGAVVGSPLFMSPEQARGLKSVDHRADVYSLGATTYTMITARPVFEAESLTDLLLKICSGDEPLPRPSLYGLPRALDGWLQICCANRPSDRYQTVKEAVSAFVIASGANPEESSISNFTDLDALRRRALEPVNPQSATLNVGSNGVSSPTFSETLDEDLSAKLGRPAPARSSFEAEGDVDSDSHPMVAVGRPRPSLVDAEETGVESGPLSAAVPVPVAMNPRQSSLPVQRASGTPTARKPPFVQPAATSTPSVRPAASNTLWAVIGVAGFLLIVVLVVLLATLLR